MMSSVKKEYAEIFNTRAGAYHQAMQNCPDARAREFQIAVELAGLKAGHWVADFPSGGGYLAAYLPEDCSLVPIEASEVFARLHPDAQKYGPIVARQHQLPLQTGTVDCTISIAGMHHCHNKPVIFSELFRITQPGGCLVLADVASESSEALFLDEFVHSQNSMGHQGEYLDTSTAVALRSAGFEIVFDQIMAFSWNFSSEIGMATFCKLLFGMDKASLQGVTEGIARYQGYESTAGSICMHWKLHYIKVIKPVL